MNEDSPVDWTQLSATVNGMLMLTPCVSFEIFLNVTEDAGLLDFYDRCRDALADRLTHYQAESMRRFARLDARVDAKVHTWFTQPRRGKTYYYAMLAGGDPADGVTAAQVEMHVYRRPAEEWMGEAQDRELAERQTAFDEERYVRPLLATQLRVTLPVDHPLADADRFRDWVLGLRIVQAGTSFSAHGGLGLNFARYNIRASLVGLADPFLAAACRRHPGLDWNGGGVLPRIVGFRPDPPQFVPLVKRANWLNLVCDQTLSRIGGREVVRGHLRGPEGVVVHDLPHGLAISAGPAPRIGDREQGDLLPAHRRVARVLRPVRIDDVDGVGAGFVAAETNRWLNAFDPTGGSTVER